MYCIAPYSCAAHDKLTGRCPTVLCIIGCASEARAAISLYKYDSLKKSDTTDFHTDILAAVLVSGRYGPHPLARFHSHIQHSARGDGVISLGRYAEHYSDADRENASGVSV